MCNDVRAIKNYLASPKELLRKVDNTLKKSEFNDVPKFEVGQLVIIKSNEDQFRIDSIIENDGESLYVSEKFHKDFYADEIEDFDEYWKAKNDK